MLVKRSIRKRVIGKQITQTNYQKKKKKKIVSTFMDSIQGTDLAKDAIISTL